jgi:hypothetical protein
MNEVDQAIQEELRRRMGVPNTRLHWAYTCSEWGAGTRPCWELVERIKGHQLIIGIHEFYTNVLVFPNGQLRLHGQAPIQCDSVEEAKEMGMTTYLLMKEGG